MKLLFAILLACLTHVLAYGQRDSTLRVSLVKTFPIEITDFTTDNLGNIYLLTSTNQLKKLNAKGDSIGVYNDVRRFGRIYSIDASNPLKVLVYYKDFSTIIVLDRLLNVRNTIDLRKQNILQVRAVTTSYDNNIWLFDEMDSRIKKIDDNGRVVLQSNDFRQVYDKTPSPEVMYDRDGQLYLYDPKKGLLVFDYYGAQKNNFPLLLLADMQVIDKNTITARDTNKVIVFKPATLQLFSYKAFKEQDIFRKIRFNGNTLFCLSNQGALSIYSTP